MKLKVACHSCMSEIPDENLEEYLPQIHEIEVHDDGRYQFCCSQGHVSIIALQEQKFEVLFQIGANAILDGYFREAVSSFTSCLERFHEFFIKVACKKHSLDSKRYDEIWKSVSNQSERQLGAFIFLWATEFGEAPKLLSSKDAGFRNSVIHKGKIPTKQESLSYGNTILDLIRPKISQIKERFPEEVQRVVFEHIREHSKLEEGQVGGGTMSIYTIVSLNISEKSHHNQSLESALDTMRKSYSRRYRS